MKFPPELYIFCIWIWILTFFYWFDFISFSPLYLSAFAFIFNTVFYQFYKLYYANKSLLWSLFIIIFECFILLINVYKHFIIDKKRIIEPSDIIISVIIFGLYLLFLKIVNKIRLMKLLALLLTC